ncbi:UDP-glycosyltransferase 89B1 [Triticum urartu]|uniref:UDP-glycosyltransferase 89B1 n=1 Tax=Triticum urartu TaxID=4572 RepID=M7ZV41_TRIUA|nr:UDP-glycosyltransferase 89B1 [Triticum urartu]
MATERPSTPHLLVVPFPAQGHALPLLDLAALLASRGLRLTVVTTPANAPLLSPLLAAHPGSVQPLVLPFPAHPSLPPGLENTRSCPPSYFPVFIHALAALRQPVLAWARSHPHPVAAVVSDFFCAWTQPLAADLGVPRIVFSPSGVLGTAVPHSLFRRLVKRPSDADDGFGVSFPAIPGEPAFQWREISGMYRGYMEGQVGEQVGEAVRQNFLWNLESWGFVSNTFRALEGRYLDSPLEDLGYKRVWAVGPLAPETSSSGDRGGEAALVAGGLGAWLDGFPQGSVVDSTVIEGMYPHSDGKKLAGEATLCWLPHTACGEWPGGRFFIPAQDAYLCSVAAASLAFFMKSQFRRSVVTINVGLPLSVRHVGGPCHRLPLLWLDNAISG